MVETQKCGFGGKRPLFFEYVKTNWWPSLSMQHEAYLVCALYFIRIAILEGWFLCFVLANGCSCESTNVHMWY